jgi:hypothetical protein
MFNIATTEPYIAQPTTTPFRWVGIPTIGSHGCCTTSCGHPKNSSPAPTKADKATWFIEQIQHIHQQVQDILQEVQCQVQVSAMINTGCHISFRWETKCGYTCRKNTLQGPIEKLLPLCYGPYTITKVVGDNDFELNIPPFLGLHPMFNVDLL